MRRRVLALVIDSSGIPKVLSRRVLNLDEEEEVVLLGYDVHLTPAAAEVGFQDAAAGLFQVLPGDLFAHGA